ncbi:MAG TPA: NADH-quinone oxidoreductase subunit NuoK [Planctomycetota bacterium]|nr:NADH-quinone oxidoreductase subunit NuoK [Planctomycetota bacterium]
MISHYLIVSAALFSIGAFGVLARRNLLIILMSVEIMLNGVNVALLAFARLYGNTHGQIFVLMVMGVAAAEVSVGLAILISVFRNRKTVDTGDLKSLQG